MMGKERTLVMITRIRSTNSGGNEWVDVWGRDRTETAMAVTQGEVKMLPLSEIAAFDFSQADVVVIAGSAHPALAQISWEKVKEHADIRVHLGRGSRVTDTNIRREYPHLRTLFQAASNYSLGEEPSAADSVVAFAQTLRDGNWNNYDAALERLRDSFWKTGSALPPQDGTAVPPNNSFTALPLRDLALLRHRLSHVFTPLLMDLQALEETGFSDDLWQEIVKECQKGYAPLKEAQAIFYGSQQNPHARLEEEKRLPLAKLLTPQGTAPDDIHAVLDAFRTLEGKATVLEKSNALLTWYAALEKLLH